MKRTWMWIGCVLVLMVLGMTSSHATDYYVAQDEQTPDPAGEYTNWGVAASNIQDAVDQAAHGDTIWIGPGWYKASAMPPVALFNTNVVFADDKALNFRGSSGNPADVIIDGDGKYRGFAASRTTSGTQGFTFDSLTISNCLSTNYSGGSAIFFNTSSRPSTSVVHNCVITHNSALRGGGIHWQASNSSAKPGLIISNSVFRNNSAINSGGAVYVYYMSNVRLIDCTIANNVADQGSALYAGGFGDILMDRCVINGNRTEGILGCVFLWGNHTMVRNSLVYDNYAGEHSSYGGIFDVYDRGILDLQNCTIVSNVAGLNGAVWVRAVGGGVNATCRVVNCVMNSNTDWNVRTKNTTYDFVYATNSCSSHTNYIPNFYADGNITNEPRFVDFPASNFRLGNGSPCIDKGTNLNWTASAIDLDGSPRRDVFTGLVDMGAYEYLYRGTMITIH